MGLIFRNRSGISEVDLDVRIYQFLAFLRTENKLKAYFNITAYKKGKTKKTANKIQWSGMYTNQV